MSTTNNTQDPLILFKSAKKSEGFNKRRNTPEDRFELYLNKEEAAKFAQAFLALGDNERGIKLDLKMGEAISKYNRPFTYAYCYIKATQEPPTYGAGGTTSTTNAATTAAGGAQPVQQVGKVVV